MEIVSSVPHLSFPVTEQSQVGEIRRAARSLSEGLGFGEKRGEKVAIVVTEAATNLALHAKQGEVLLCPATDTAGGARLDIIAIDRGPGIADIGRSVADGFSTAGTAGNGLGAIKRLSDEFDLFSNRGTGTILFSRMYGACPDRSGGSIETERLAAGFICIPKTGERLCGDTVAVRLNGRCAALMVADGLGHGFAANEASLEAARIFSTSTTCAPGELLDAIHHGLRGTRGAAVAVACTEEDSRNLKYAGVGNIAGAIVQDSTSRSLVSHNGIVGHLTHKIQEFNYPWEDSSVLIMNSDGLQSTWRLNQYPGVLKRHPAVIAAILYRDFSRGRDDVGILVVRRDRHA